MDRDAEQNRPPSGNAGGGMRPEPGSPPMREGFPPDAPAPADAWARRDAWRDLPPLEPWQPPSYPRTYYVEDERGGFAAPPQQPPPRMPRRPGGPRGRGPSRRRPWLVALSLLLLVAMIGGGALAYARLGPGHGGRAANPCAPNTPCQVANAYLAAYSKQDMATAYRWLSPASQQRFANAKILGGNFSNAQDYIINRTLGILQQARIYAISASNVLPSSVKRIDATHARVAVRLVYKSTRVGQFGEQVTLPLVQEKGRWAVDWTPGLIFPQLDDASDPYYSRKVHLFTLDAPRGTIYDRDGNVLAKDDTVYVVGVVPQSVTNKGQMLQVLSGALDLSPDQIQARIAGQDPTQFVALRTLAPQQFQPIENTLNAVAGVAEQTSTGRVYPYGEATAPVTGYVSIVTADDLKNDTAHIYENGDFLGRAGVEGWGEQYLRPQKGGKLEIVGLNDDGSYDQAHAVVIAARDAVPGASIHTTISLAAQQAAMQALAMQDGHGGGTLALDPATGAVLALGSFPFYDPNNFSLGFTPNAYARFNALDHPYLNRAIASAEPVGSVFKVITLAAALQNNISPTQVFTCTGSYQVPGENHIRNDDDPHGHGSLTAPLALGPSCDVVFWKVAVQLNSKDPNLLPNMAKSFGFGAHTGIVGISPDEENPGIVPDPQYLKQTKNAEWTPTDAANLGTGQGFFEATPAQVALAAAAIANNGVRMQPRLVSAVNAADGTSLATYPAKQVGTLSVSADNLSTIQAALLGPTYAPNGTATRDFVNFPIRVAGKTGTAESGQAHPHAWFACYAPAPPVSGGAVPQIAVGTLVEYSDFGERYAVPVSKAILLAYLRP